MKTRQQVTEELLQSIGCDTLKQACDVFGHEQIIAVLCVDFAMEALRESEANGFENAREGVSKDLKIWIENIQRGNKENEERRPNT